MAIAGGKKSGGRTKGTPNKATVERKLLAEQAMAASKAMENPEVRAAVAGIEGTKVAVRKLGKDILDEFANVLAGAAAFYQPIPGNPNADPTLFKEYARLAVDAADRAAAYQSPKLSAVMVGAVVVQKIKIEGGLPDLDQAPETIDATANPPEPPAQIEAPPMAQPVGAK
jgi:hypothetical protein